MRVAALLMLAWLMLSSTAWGQSDSEASQALSKARSLRNSGKLIAARVQYQAIVDEKLAHADAQALETQRTAREELAMLEGRIPTLTITVQGPSENLQITVDDAASSTGKPVQLDPGEHTVLARRSGAVVARKTLRLAPSDHVNVVLAIRGEKVDEEPAGPSRGWISLVIVGAVFVAGGIGTGIAAAVIDGDLDDRCGDGACHPQLDKKVKNFHILGYVSTGALAIGGPLLGIGVAWRLFLYDDSEAAPAVSITPGGIQIEGRF